MAKNPKSELQRQVPQLIYTYVHYITMPLNVDAIKNNLFNKYRDFGGD
jgi:hypothetical protein